ncbi:uncharacterized protein SOCEGT47_060210 [Sorangium cellulosum]|uniref:Uncharacterized protein n=1 Tax=Sorangium cellulosum TaxID=56 RepID=A0A4P2Q7H2_SORCE|nr:uncharacterized protein SOCEGT47_060210 [Sorangium cellulosum]
MPCRPRLKATEADAAPATPPVPDDGAPQVPRAMEAVHCDEAPQRSPLAAGTLTRAVTSARDELAESWILCSAMVALALAWLAWSQPLPSARDLSFVALCMALVVIEHRRAKSRLRKAAALAGCPGEAPCQVISRDEGTGSACQEPGQGSPDTCAASWRVRAVTLVCPRRSTSLRRRRGGGLRLHERAPAARACRRVGRRCRRRRGEAATRCSGAAAGGARVRRLRGTGPSGGTQGKGRRAAARDVRQGRVRRAAAAKGVPQSRIRRAAARGVPQGRIRRAAARGVPQGRIRRAAASSRG